MNIFEAIPSVAAKAALSSAASAGAAQDGDDDIEGPESSLDGALVSPKERWRPGKLINKIAQGKKSRQAQKKEMNMVHEHRKRLKHPTHHDTGGAQQISY